MFLTQKLRNIIESVLFDQEQCGFQCTMKYMKFYYKEQSFIKNFTQFQDY